MWSAVKNLLEFMPLAVHYKTT